MKKSHFIGILVIAVAVFVIISTAGDASTYVNFDEAKALSAAGNSKKVHVVGQLKKNERGEIVGVEPGIDKLTVTFLMVDNSLETGKVFYNKPMPPDLQQSEQVVVIGNYKNDVFIANQILLKCPSKYEEESLQVSEAK
ncbi:MAG: cytochrome c maturation protein CcmE [Cyclobacteriaceae bacterium]|nr:cytochrome c maturation protein CcmE [Cyclobacteriaceae bacterium]